MVLLWIRASYQHVIEVGIANGQDAVDIVYEPLECLSCVPQTKGHLQELEKTKGGGNCCLWDVFEGYQYLVVSSDQVNLRKGCATMGAKSCKCRIW